MPVTFDGKLVVAISSRALFNLEDSHRIYESEGLAAYHVYQVAHEDEVLEPGDAFPLVRKLLSINQRLPGDPRVEVILLSRNSSDTGLRVFNSIQHYGLPISLCGWRESSPLCIGVWYPSVFVYGSAGCTGRVGCRFCRGDNFARRQGGGRGGVAYSL